MADEDPREDSENEPDDDELGVEDDPKDDEPDVLDVDYESDESELELVVGATTGP